MYMYHSGAAGRSGAPILLLTAPLVAARQPSPGVARTPQLRAEGMQHNLILGRVWIHCELLPFLPHDLKKLISDARAERQQLPDVCAGRQQQRLLL